MLIDKVMFELVKLTIFAYLYEIKRAELDS
jgi:hypothetical protein